MDKFPNLPYKQLLFPPFRKETNVSNEEIPIYSAINPILPPFLPYRSVSKFPKYPGFQQQIKLLEYNDKKK